MPKKTLFVWTELVIVSFGLIGTGIGFLNVFGWGQGLRPLMQWICWTLCLGIMSHTMFVQLKPQVKPIEWRPVHAGIGYLLPLAVIALLLEPLLRAYPFEKQIRTKFNLTYTDGSSALESPLFDYGQWVTAPLYSACRSLPFVRETVNTTFLYKRVGAAPNPVGFYKRLSIHASVQTPD